MVKLHPYQQKLLIDLEGISAGELMVIASGRRIGKSYLNQMYGSMMGMRKSTKIQWTRHDKHLLSLVATKLAATSNEFIDFLTEDEMVDVANWCKECNCGTRTSFDTIKFKNEKQITMFLMKWTS